MLSRIKKWLAPKPQREFRHPSLGTFKCEHGSDLWFAEVLHGDRKIGLCLRGDASAPNGTLIAAVAATLTRFNEVCATAVSFLTSPDSRIVANHFTPYGLVFYYPEKPSTFTVEFEYHGDPDGIHRAEFVDGVPKYAGRDD